MYPIGLVIGLLFRLGPRILIVSLELNVSPIAPCSTFFSIATTSPTDIPTDTYTQTHRHTDTQTHKHTDTQTHRHTDTQTNRHTQNPKITPQYTDKTPQTPTQPKSQLTHTTQIPQVTSRK